MYIELLGRGDRLGANISCFIAQIIWAIHYDAFIVYNKNHIKDGDNVRFVPYDQNYNNSIFIRSLFYFIDIHNKKLLINNQEMGENMNMFTIHFFEIISKVLLKIKIDYFTYFKLNIFPVLNNYFEDIAKQRGYFIPFNPKKTILVHLRLDDVRNSSDYDGFHCADHFRKEINNDKITDNNTDANIKAIYPHCNRQSPLSKNKIDNLINKALINNPGYEVVLLTNPGENTDEYPYRCIQNADESFDLYILANCEVVILSRSTFSLSSIFFNGNAKEVYIPLWGHLPCFGLFTKYDNTLFNYF
jgi:hypothetical protein